MKSPSIWGSILRLALLKLYVNLQVTRLLNKKPARRSGVFITVALTVFCDASRLKACINLEGKTKKKLARVWCLQMPCATTSNVFLSASLLSCWSVMVCLTVTLMQISALWAPPLDPLSYPSRLDWVWQVEEGMDITDSTNFNETNLSYGLTFWNSPCEWQCQQSPLLKLSREGPCNDGGN